MGIDGRTAAKNSVKAKEEASNEKGHTSTSKHQVKSKEAVGVHASADGSFVPANLKSIVEMGT
jgi:hypothetical protein